MEDDLTDMSPYCQRQDIYPEGGDIPPQGRATHKMQHSSSHQTGTLMGYPVPLRFRNETVAVSVLIIWCFVLAGKGTGRYEEERSDL